MKIIIKESQYKRLLNEQNNVYVDNSSYESALKEYNKELKLYTLCKKYFDLLTSLKLPGLSKNYYPEILNLADINKRNNLIKLQADYNVGIKTKYVIYYYSESSNKHEKTKVLYFIGEDVPECGNCASSYGIVSFLVEKPVKPILKQVDEKPSLVLPDSIYSPIPEKVFNNKEEYEIELKNYNLANKLYTDFLNNLEDLKKTQKETENLPIFNGWVADSNCDGKYDIRYDSPFIFLNTIEDIEKLGACSESNDVQYVLMTSVREKNIYNNVDEVNIWKKKNEKNPIKEIGFIHIREEGINVPVYNPPTYKPIYKEPEKVKTDFSATFGWAGKQETRYFKTFDEWKKFYDSLGGKWTSSNWNNSKTKASVLLKGTPEDWGL